MDNFTFYPTFSVDDLREYMPDVPVLLPASSWARKGLATPKLPDHIKHRTTNKGADCGGFVATRIWGDYRYTPAQYVDWLERWNPTWSATMDYCCESPITGGRQEVVYKRQDRTTEMAYHFWQNYRNTPWCWVPTIQGWEPDDYRKHARELHSLIEEMSMYYGPSSEWRVGVGTLCARAKVREIDAVLQAVREELPSVPLHVWGIKLTALKSIDLTNVVSSDSAMWHGMWGERRQAMTEAAQERGISRRRYVMTFQLPHFIEQVQAAVCRAPALSSQYDMSPHRDVFRSLGWTWCVRVRARREYVYAARRVSGSVKEYYISSLADMLRLPIADVCIKLLALPNSNETGIGQYQTLWNSEIVGKTRSPRACPTEKGSAAW